MTAATISARRHRWVLEEPDLPFDLPVIYEDGHIIVVDKPHFVPTMPRGMWYRQSALIRLREGFGEPDIVPAHRLDRMTAGVLVFVRDPAARGAYQTLFQNGHTAKTYECLAPLAPVRTPRFGTVRRENRHHPFPLERSSRIVKTRHVLQAYEEPGTPNARTLIRREGLALPSAPTARPSLSSASRLARYSLQPLTGKTHQLRVHMSSLGLAIAGDDFYPEIRERAVDDFSEPLQLVARELAFTDPFTGEPRIFRSSVMLEVPPSSVRGGVPRT